MHNQLATIGNRCVKILEFIKNCMCLSCFDATAHIGNCTLVSASNTITTPQRDSIAHSVCFVNDGRDLVIRYLDSHEVTGTYHLYHKP